MNFLNRHRVLYAEDNEDSCFMVTTTLGLADIEVITAGTIAEAWRLGQAEHFDLYLLDSRLPDGCGLELCRRLREHAPHTPILLYSGDAAETDVQKGLAAGANEYLTKPYFGDLNVTIKENIERAEQSARPVEIIPIKTKSTSLNY